MMFCPICQAHAEAYQFCAAESLGKLLGYAPAILDRREEWRLVRGLVPPAGGPPATSHLCVATLRDQTQDGFLIRLCEGCAADARTALGLRPDSLYPLEASQCPICGFYTLPYERCHHESCDVCGWSNWEFLTHDYAPDLRKARRVYEATGVASRRRWLDTRPPYPCEYPVYHR